MKGGVELLEIRPEQLTSNDLGGEQVALEHAASGVHCHLLQCWYYHQSVAYTL